MNKTYKCAGMHAESGKHYELDTESSNMTDAICNFNDWLHAAHGITIDRLSELDISEAV